MALKSKNVVLPKHFLTDTFSWNRQWFNLSDLSITYFLIFANYRLVSKVLNILNWFGAHLESIIYKLIQRCKLAILIYRRNWSNNASTIKSDVSAERQKCFFTYEPIWSLLSKLNHKNLLLTNIRPNLHILVCHF